LFLLFAQASDELIEEAMVALQDANASAKKTSARKRPRSMGNADIPSAKKERAGAAGDDDSDENADDDDNDRPLVHRRGDVRKVGGDVRKVGGDVRKVGGDVRKVGGDVRKVGGDVRQRPRSLGNSDIPSGKKGRGSAAVDDDDGDEDEDDIPIVLRKAKQAGGGRVVGEAGHKAGGVVRKVAGGDITHTTPGDIERLKTEKARVESALERLSNVFATSEQISDPELAAKLEEVAELLGDPIAAAKCSEMAIRLKPQLRTGVTKAELESQRDKAASSLTKFVEYMAAKQEEIDRLKSAEPVDCFQVICLEASLKGISDEVDKCKKEVADVEAQIEKVAPIDQGLIDAVQAGLNELNLVFKKVLREMSSRVIFHKMRV
jgi:archaellum component FlaC